jgi:hypothetical protein
MTSFFVLKHVFGHILSILNTNEYIFKDEYIVHVFVISLLFDNLEYNLKF